MEPSQWNLKTSTSLSHEDLVENGSLKLKVCTGADGEIRLNHILDNADIATCKELAPPSFAEVKPAKVDAKTEKQIKNLKNDEPLPICMGVAKEVPLKWDGENKADATCKSGAPYTVLTPSEFFELHHV